MPAELRDGFEKALEESGLASPVPPGHAPSLLSITNGSSSLRIGDVELAKLGPAAAPELVPDIVFHDTPAHLAVLRSMMRDLAVGNRALLAIGTQGTGKNKLADRLLQLLGREREYIQLHRDTTVQALTLAPTLEGGRVVWRDSPLVKAVTAGRVLVVDEADKAPVEVVCILKGLVEDGHMHLSDGRVIRDARSAASQGGFGDGAADTIAMHPDFRMIVLANRPGYPFLGNDFFAEVGDVFCCHVVENLDPESEVALLRAYVGDALEPAVVSALTSAFAEIRGLVDEGLITYPYSTRELVNVARHLAQFGRDSPEQGLDNVFAFDAFDADAKTAVTEVFHRHGIPLYARDPLGPVVRLAAFRDLDVETHRWVVGEAARGDRGAGPGLAVTALSAKVSSADYLWNDVKTLNVADTLVPGRVTAFTEQLAAWSLSLDGGETVETGVLCAPPSPGALEAGEAGGSEAGEAGEAGEATLHLLTGRPRLLYTLDGPDFLQGEVVNVSFLPSHIEIGMEAVGDAAGTVVFHALGAGVLFTYVPSVHASRQIQLPEFFTGARMRVCVSMCVRLALFWRKRLPHTAHGNGLSPEWTRMWRCSEK